MATQVQARLIRAEVDEALANGAVDVTATIKPYNYITGADTWQENVRRDYCGQQYRKGLKMAQDGAAFFISMTGSWSAVVPSTIGDGIGHVTAYERLGYHAGTADLIRGWLDGGAIIVDYRPKYNS